MIDRDELAMLLADNNHLIALLESHGIDWRPLTRADMTRRSKGEILQSLRYIRPRQG